MGIPPFAQLLTVHLKVDNGDMLPQVAAIVLEGRLALANAPAAAAPQTHVVAPLALLSADGVNSGVSSQRLLASTMKEATTVATVVELTATIRRRFDWLSAA